MRGAPSQRLAHQPAGIDGEDHRVVALGAELLGQQLAVPGRLLPVDGAPVHAGRELAQGVELASPRRSPAAPSRPKSGVAGEEPDRLVLHRADVGRDRRSIRFGVSRDLLPDQAERPAPARPELLDLALAAPQRRQLEASPRASPPRTGAGGAVGAERRAARSPRARGLGHAPARGARSVTCQQRIGASTPAASGARRLQAEARRGRAARPAARRPGTARRPAPPRPAPSHPEPGLRPGRARARAARRRAISATAREVG